MKSAEDETVVSPVVSPASPAKGDSRVKSWLKARFSSSNKTPKETEDGDANKPAFVGGAALTGANAGDTSDSPERARDDSVREVAMVGRTSTHETDDLYGSSEKNASPVNDATEKRASRSPSISSLSSKEDDAEGKEKTQRGRPGFKERLLGKSATRESADDDFEEARDTFEEEKLEPPPKVATIAEGEPSSKSSKYSNSPSRDRSKFTEDL